MNMSQLLDVDLVLNVRRDVKTGDIMRALNYYNNNIHDMKTKLVAIKNLKSNECEFVINVFQNETELPVQKVIAGNWTV